MLHGLGFAVLPDLGGLDEPAPGELVHHVHQLHRLVLFLLLAHPLQRVPPLLLHAAGDRVDPVGLPLVVLGVGLLVRGEVPLPPPTLEQTPASQQSSSVTVPLT